MGYRRHVTLKGQTRNPIRLERNISKTAGFRDSVPKDHQ